MKYLTGHSQEIRELLDALRIPCEGVTSIRLIVEPEQIVRLEVGRCVTTDEMSDVIQWILKYGIEAEALPMTDLTPNDLSHLSDRQFNALCPQGYHAPGPATALSPAAQAVLDAAMQYEINPECYSREIAAAALRAAADQVVPREEWPDQSIGFADWNLATERCEQRKNIRANLLAIAAELEANR